MTQSPSNQAEQYISGVLDGSNVTSKLVRLACERHRRDLQDGRLRNLRFSPKHGQHVIDFIQTFCCHSQGEWAGQLFKLAPWQQALLWILYGWRWADTDYRRFKFAYIELAKGNGKSMLASALGVYELIASNEPGAEVYSVATKKDQARIVFAEAERMIEASPDLKKRIKSYRDCLFLPGNSGAKFQPLSSDEDSLDGPRPQCLICDEIHAWSYKGRKLWDLLAQSLGKRRSPVFIAITTSGTGEESLCRQQNRYSEKVLSGVHAADDWFAWICGLDEGDLFDDPAVWIKANPNLNVSVNVKELAEAINKAKGDPASLNGVLRLRLGIWTQAAEAFIPMEEWELCNAPIDLDSLKQQPCFGGLDLSTTTDVSAFILLFPPYRDRSKWVVLPTFFLPKDCIEKRSRIDRVPYESWARNHQFTLTSGNVIDYQVIRLRIVELSKEYDIREIAYDPWACQESASWLQDHGFIVSPVRQGFQTLAGPTKRLLELIMTHDLAHMGHPVLRWMASNVIADMDATGSVKPDKTKSSEKIDGISALLCALSRAMVVNITPHKKTTFAPFFV